MKTFKIRGHYYLDGKNPVLVEDFKEWIEKTPLQNNNVQFDIIEEGIEVSTVFLGFDHNRPYLLDKDEEYKPLLFETMVFGGEYDDYMMRYSTWDEAVLGHNEIVAKCFGVELKENKNNNDINREKN